MFFSSSLRPQSRHLWSSKYHPGRQLPQKKPFFNTHYIINKKKGGKNHEKKNETLSHPFINFKTKKICHTCVTFMFITNLGGYDICFRPTLSRQELLFIYLFFSIVVTNECKYQQNEAKKKKRIKQKKNNGKKTQKKRVSRL